MRHLWLPALVAILLMSMQASAQPPAGTQDPGTDPPRMPPPGAGPMDGPPMGRPGMIGPGKPMPPGRGGQAEEDLRDLLQQVMMARVSRSLDLNEEQTVILVRRFSEHQDAMMALRKKRHDLTRGLDEAMEKGDNDAAINEKLEALIALDEEAAMAPKRLLDTASKGLDATQRAKLYMMLLEFEADLRNMVMKARQRRGFEGAPQGRGRADTTRGGAEELRGLVPRPRGPQVSRGQRGE